MRPSDGIALAEPAKQAFASFLADRLRAVPGVRSVTFTGSFVEKAGLGGISDIDVVVVAGVLDSATFAACRDAAGTVPPEVLGLPGHRLVINDTFGPLKFDEPGVIVVHLMVYDIAGHRDHVLQSPFTCLDWERSPCHAGRSLRSLYPVFNLQPRQFFEARRSLSNYLQDIASGSISYRRHQFDGSVRKEILERLPLDPRHQGEYAYHIVRNLVTNYAKLIHRENRPWPEPALLGFWDRHLPGCRSFMAWFADLGAIKHSRRSDFPAGTPKRTREFLAAFAHELASTWNERAIRHHFVRHARTGLNTGAFLGQGRDPGILDRPAPLTATPTKIFSSPARRCRETATALAPGAAPVIDARLHEIDYGQAEGLDFAELQARFPELPAAWARGEDPCFPEGENTTAVATRLKSFLDDLPPEPALVVTHNVVLRCLLGSGLGLPPACWHRIPVNHAETLEVLRLDGTCYLNLAPGQIAAIGDALAGHLT